MLEGSCHCAAVRIGLPRLPAKGNRCECSICRSYGVIWVYFAEDEVAFEGHPERTVFYRRRPDGLRFVRCRDCGCVTHWEAHAGDPDRRIGVNLNLFDPEAVAAVPVHPTAGPPEPC